MFFKSPYMYFSPNEKGRIFVEKEQDISVLIGIIKKLYPNEAEALPANLIAVFSGENYDSVSTQNFVDVNMTDILFEAWNQGIKCFCVFGDFGALDNSQMKFPYKHYGRIFVEKEDDIRCLKFLIKGMDDFEYDYLPNDLITTFSDHHMYSVYTHKFDSLNMADVMCSAWEEGLKCFCVFGLINEFDDEF